MTKRTTNGGAKLITGYSTVLIRLGEIGGTGGDKTVFMGLGEIRLS